MKAPRPITLLLGALAVAGLARTAESVLTHAEPETDSMFVSAARAAGAPAPKPEPSKTETPAKASQAVCETPEEMLEAMSEERALLDAQKARMTERQSEMELAAETLRIDQTRLEDLKGEVESLLSRIKKAQTDDVDRLVALYSAMKPKEAAAIMNDLDIEVSVMVLGTMPERDAAPILARLDPVRARAISRIILERSKLPGDQRLDNLKL